MVVVGGNLGIFNQSKLERISSDISANAGDKNIKLNNVLKRVGILEQKEKALPKSFLRKKLRGAEKGLLGGRGQDSSLKLLGLKLSGSGAGAPIQGNQSWKKLNDKVDKIGSDQRAISKVMSLFAPIVSGSSGLTSLGGLGNMLLGQAAKIGLPISFITLIATKVWEQYKSQYGKGNTRDVRKLVLDEDVSRIGIENENELESGENLFMSNPQVLSGAARGPSNTENLREGMARWKQRHEGAYN